MAPGDLVPLDDLPLTLRRVERFDVPARPVIGAPPVKAGLELRGRLRRCGRGRRSRTDVVYVGGQDGGPRDRRANRARSAGLPRGGPIRTRPTVAGRGLYVQADDGYLYKLAAASGDVRWRVRMVERPIDRLPFDNPSRATTASAPTYGRRRAPLSRHPRRQGAGARSGAGREGLGVRRRRQRPRGAGHRRRPRGVRQLRRLRLRAGRRDRASSQWKRDTRGRWSRRRGRRRPRRHRESLLRPARARRPDRRVAWKRYIWMSWVESSATMSDGVAYVGSSDAAAVYAFDARSGKRLWATDVFGWSWGQPAVTEARLRRHVEPGGYLARHKGVVMALDRATGTSRGTTSRAGRDRGLRIPRLAGAGGGARVRRPASTAGSTPSPSTLDE